MSYPARGRGSGSERSRSPSEASPIIFATWGEADRYAILSSNLYLALEVERGQTSRGTVGMP